MNAPAPNRAAAPCRRCQSPLEAHDLRCAVCSLPAPFAPSAAPAAPVRILRCDGCGAALAYDARAQAPRCAFCASVMHVEAPADPLEEATLALPFAIGPDAARGLLRGWMGSLGFFRPGDLASVASVDRVQALGFCAWIVDADALVSFTADSDAGSGRSDWAPHAGQVRMRFAGLLVPASRGLRSEECARLGPGYDLSRLVAVPPAQTGHGGEAIVDPRFGSIERFDVQRSMARATVIEAIERTAAARVTHEGHVPGRRFRNVHASVLLTGLSTRRVALPVYVLAYRYDGKSYRALVHGTAEGVVMGDAPVSYRRVAVVVLGVVMLIAAIATLVAVLGR